MGTLTTVTTFTTVTSGVTGVLSVRLKLIPKLMLTTTTLDSMETTKPEAMDIMNNTNPQPTLATTVMVTTTTDPTTSTTTLSTDSPSIIRVTLQMENSRIPAIIMKLQLPDSTIVFVDF